MPKQRPERKANPREEALKRGRTLLAAWGIHDGALPPSTPPDQVVAALAPLIGRDPACDLLIAEWLGRIADPSAAERLAAWEAEAADKEVKREIRRSLFRLDQKGIRLPRREEPRPAFTLAADAAEPEGYLGPVDGEGSRIAWLLKKDAGGLSGLFTVINDREGMVAADAGSLSRQSFADAMKDLAGSSPGPLVKVPWRYADALMNAAFRRRAPRPGGMKADYLLARADVTKDPPAEETPCPVRDALTPEETADPALLDRSADLFREREFKSWVFPDEIARPHLQAVLNVQTSGLVVSKEAATERVVGIMDAALEEMVAGPLRAVYVRRLEEMAWLLLLTGRRDQARRSLAVARALEAPEGRRMKDVSFLRALVFRAFIPVLYPGGRAPEHAASDPASEMAEGSSRIIDPSKAREAGVPGAGRVDDSGEDAPSLIIRP